MTIDVISVYRCNYRLSFNGNIQFYHISIRFLYDLLLDDFNNFLEINIFFVSAECNSIFIVGNLILKGHYDALTLFLTR